MPRPMIPFVALRRTPGKFILASTVVNKLRTIVAKWPGASDIRDFRAGNAEWTRLVALLQHNPVHADFVNGMPVAIGGVTSGRDNPHKTLDEIVKMRDWRDLKWHPSSTGDRCEVCGAEIGMDVFYTTRDGRKSEYEQPSLNISHSVPAIFGGCASIHNTLVECAKCNKLRGTQYDAAIHDWLRTVKLAVYE